MKNMDSLFASRHAAKNRSKQKLMNISETNFGLRSASAQNRSKQKLLKCNNFLPKKKIPAKIWVRRERESADIQKMNVF